MGDFHFIVRHALTGVVLLAFSLGTCWIADPKLAGKIIESLTKANNLTAALAALTALTPVIGVIVQGIYTACLYHRSGHGFTDMARKAIAERIREQVFKNLTLKMSAEVRQQCCKILSDAEMPDDSLFVWLYHVDAPPHLVEWARRRRSYHYLGMNWAIAAGLGVLTGLVVPGLVHAGRTWQIVFLVVAAMIWIAGTWWLARKMEHDVDCMEMAWAYSYLNPEFKSLLQTLQPNEIVTRESESEKRESKQA